MGAVGPMPEAEGHWIEGREVMGSEEGQAGYILPGGEGLGGMEKGQGVLGEGSAGARTTDLFLLP